MTGRRWIKGFFWAVIHMMATVLIVLAVVIVSRPSETSGSQPNFAGVEQKQKRLVLFLDGTWNSIDSNTNVWRMRSLCAAQGRDGKPQLVYYEIGVNGFLGGVFGKGLDENIRRAYEWLVENYNPGDEIYIFGFSRGAYTARSLAGLVAMNGILRAGSPIGVSELFDRYKRANEETIWKLQEIQEAGDTAKFTQQENWLLKYSQPAKITVVGVWDTVGSVGWELGNIPGISRSSFGYLHTGLRIHILNAYHALAIDEHRGDFSPTLWDMRFPKDRKAVIAQWRPLASVEQRWFVGAHANVGGGYPADMLAQGPLRWMMKKAEAHGLTFRSEVDLDGDAKTARIADSYNAFMYGGYALLHDRLYRPIGARARVEEDGAHVNVNETIDASVFDRWRADSSYRPTNLVEWARRKRVDPALLHSSVRAANPSVTVPDQ
jgi:uncharacterized protein (DUF2235 family)